MNKYEVRNIRIPVKSAYQSGLDACVAGEIKNIIGTSDFIYSGLLRKSIDARRKSSVFYDISALVSAEEVIRGPNVLEYDEYVYRTCEPGGESLAHRPVIAGSGPCGIFAAYVLAERGFRPIVVERGSRIEDRKRSVKDFWDGRDLDEDTNVQFGEGGAGTFSDGKLVTRINDPRSRFVLEKLVEAGAPCEILYESRPHIGTDRLSRVILNLRKKIEEMGGQFIFNAKVGDISCPDGVIRSVRLDDGTEIDTRILVAATGHSARDTYRMFLEKGVLMEQKPFSAGLRIEHIREDVNISQWGKSARYIPDSAEYAANCMMDVRNAYTFCMCPGGIVVNASSEGNGLAVNGMSYSARDGRNSNSAWVAEIRKRDFPSEDPLAGIELQREIERAAFIAGGSDYSAPVQKLGDFLSGTKSVSFGRVRPSFTGNTVFSDLNAVLPAFISSALRESLGGISRRLGFFSDSEAVLTGCETRTSSPVRILRNREFESVSVSGLYPGGEGAGYAGGIMSAAIDGIKVANAIVKRYNYRG